MKVALIGQTNVGKSSLFNRLIGQQKAIVSPIPGTTRDRNFGVCDWQGFDFTLIDTGGLDIKQASVIERDVVRQAKLAAEKADLILLVLDVTIGLLPQDKELVVKLRKQKKPFLVIINKCDSPRLRHLAFAEFSGLAKTIWPVSAVNGTGTGDLLDEVVKELSKSPSFKKAAEQDPELLTKVAIMGRPNVGKSTLLNALMGEEFVIVSDIPHTTREPQDTLMTHKDRLILLIDTAGVRKKARVRKGVEEAAVERGLKALHSADVAVLMLEADQPITVQDKHLANEIVEAGASVIIVFNKWDLLSSDEKIPKKFQQKVEFELPFIKWAPIVFVSAQKKRNVFDILDLALELKETRQKFVEEKALEKFLKDTIKLQKPAAAKGPKPPRLLGLKQIDTSPPYFELIADYRQLVPRAYLKFIERRLREKFGFKGTPIKIKVRGIK